jgi:nicotinamidase-related amidase
VTQKVGLDSAALGAVYRERGLGGRVGFGQSPAVVIVDMQAGFNDVTCPLGADMSASLDAVAELLAAAREKEVPAVYVWSAWNEAAEDSGRWREKIAGLAAIALGSPNAEIASQIAPRAGDTLVLKKGPSGFFNTPLDDVLREARIDTVILTGASTSGCIRATAIDSLSHGYRTVLPAEAVGDRAEDPHRSNLFDIDAKYGDVLPLETVLHYLGELEPEPERRRAAADTPPRVPRGEATVCGTAVSA